MTMFLRRCNCPADERDEQEAVRRAESAPAGACPAMAACADTPAHGDPVQPGRPISEQDAIEIMRCLLSEAERQPWGDAFLSALVGDLRTRRPEAVVSLGDSFLRSGGRQ